jgi:hypothetical protein
MKMSVCKVLSVLMMTRATKALSCYIIEVLEESYVKLMSNDFSEVTEVAQKLLAKNGLTIPIDSSPFKKLCRELLIAEQKVLKTELKRWDGDCSDRFLSVAKNYSWCRFIWRRTAEVVWKQRDKVNWDPYVRGELVNCVSDMKLNNRTVIITGGSRGIGKSIAREYLKEGANVVIASRGEEELGNTIKEFQSITRNRVLGIQTDVSVKERVQELIGKTEHEFGCVDVLVNAAGILSPVGSLLDVD